MPVSNRDNEKATPHPKEAQVVSGPEPSDGCDTTADVPGCGTGPFGRVGWTLREIAGLLRRKGGSSRDDRR